MNQFRKQEDEEPPVPAPAVPQFRSVSMMAPPPVPLARSLQPPAMPKAAPLLTRPAEKLVISSSPKVQYGDSSSWSWKLSKVAPVPIYHPLERTAISCTEPLDVITARISSFMKSHSIQCSYQDDMGRVNCSTDMCLQFAVQLWQRNETTTVIEVQRRQGCCIMMQSLRQQLKESILYGHDSVEQKPALSQRACAFLQQVPVDRAEYLTSCLDVTVGFLKSNLLDQNRLGLESLVVLTDASKVLAQDAKETSTQVLQDPQFHKLLERFLSSESSSLSYDEHANGTMHLLTLKALVHALESTKESLLSIDLGSSFWRKAMEAMYKNVQLANERPMEAALSIRAFNLLKNAEPSIMAIAMQKPQLSQYMEVARDFGRQHNQSLQRETELFLRNHVH